MAGAYTGGAYPLGITRDDVSLDDHFGWAPEDQVADAPVLFSVCIRCSKSIASGRVCDRPGHRACGFCSANNSTGCDPVGISP